MFVLFFEGFNLAYSMDKVYREDHHTLELMPKSGAPGRAVVVALPGGKHDDLGGSVVMDEGVNTILRFKSYACLLTVITLLALSPLLSSLSYSRCNWTENHRIQR